MAKVVSAQMDGEFYTEDATKTFLSPSSVDLFITNPPFYGIHVDEYGSANKQMHNTETISEFIDNLVLATLEMQKALKPDGHILLILPNKPFIFEYIVRISGSSTLNFGQMLVWDLMKIESSIENYSALVLDLHDGGHIDPGNELLRFPLGDISDLGQFTDIGFPWDSLPMQVYAQLIEKFSKPGNVVADILGGTGSICLAAIDTNRKFIYNDVSDEQTAIAVKRYELYKKKAD